MSSSWRILDSAAPNWDEEVDARWARLDAATSVPDYFVKTTFVKLGGRLAVDATGAVGLLFPRGFEAGHKVYTLRLQGAGSAADLAALVAPDRLVAYDPSRPALLTYAPTFAERGGFHIGAPAREELAAISGLHGAIWGGGDAARYPVDLFSAEFGPATALAARRDGRLAGFLLGFYRFGLPALGADLPIRRDLGIESQVMGVAPEARRFGLAAALKREQARMALAQAVELIHWTADPLQYPNAVLNFARLRAVAGEHYPSYYSFRNELNRVPASRLGLLWLPRSARGRVGLDDAQREQERGLGRFPGCARLNVGPTPLDNPGEAPYLALAIPIDWTALQRDEIDLAAAWRGAADELLARHLGFAEGRYLVVDAASAGDERFLILQRYTAELLT